MNKTIVYSLILFCFATSCEQDEALENVPNVNIDCVYKDDYYFLIQKTFSDDQLPQVANDIILKEKTTSPLLIANKPWESAGINYASVLRVNGKWKMWYESFDNNSYTDFDTYLCYAESNDGINWIKPDLHLANYDGDSRNNIIMHGGFHGISVFYDHNGTGEDAYRLIFTKPNVRDGSWIYGMSSADGLNFKDLVLLTKTYSDTQTSIFYDEGKYKMYTRIWDGGKIGIGRRAVGYTESVGFGINCFPLPAKILSLEKSYDKDLYNNGATKIRESLYLMFPSVFNYNSDQIIPHLATSVDGINFNLHADQAFIPLNSKFDGEMIYVSPGAIKGDAPNEYIFYYLGKDINHSVGLDEIKSRYTGGIGRFILEIN